ncbi:MAG: GGDEF domain-containing protein [Clostridia bacterium]|nr:GGDEF domain-containing protein [Clostridia bacterium]
MQIGIIIFLVILIAILAAYNLSISKKIKTFSNINEKISNLNVLQDFIDTIGKDMPVNNKIEVINDIIIQKFNIKYSTIVVFNGAEYVLKTSNVDEKHWETLRNLHTEEIFKDSIMTATPKHITVDKPEEKLPYQKFELGRAKSAIFFPLYIDNIYIGYWIIESNEPHAFDHFDTNILGIVKENIVAVLKTVSYQNTIENIYRVDKTTGLNSAEYLYGKAKTIIDKYPQSTICMFTITNIEDINKKFNRNIGTDVIVKMTNLIKTSISAEYIFVRYMGPKFAIVFSGVDEEGVMNFVTSIKKEIEKIRLSKKSKTKKEVEYTFPRTNFAIANYYKGTGLEEVTKKLEEYLDNANINESNINCI